LTNLDAASSLVVAQASSVAAPGGRDFAENTMTQLANIALALALLAAAPLSAAADSPLTPGGVHRLLPPNGIAPLPRGPTSKVCTGPHVTVWVTDPATGRREKRCKCAPGAIGIATKNVATGAAALRCLRQAGPRP
jgi:hypothetical protein